MVTTWPKNFPGLGTSAERVAQSITALSGGRLQVKVFAAGQLVNAFESFDAVSSGLADMYHGAENYWDGRSAAFSYFCAVPFGLTAAEMNAWVYYGGGQALWDELSAGFGLKPFLCGNTGAQMGGWFTKELTGIESFKGLRYRMPGLGGEVLRRLGAVVVNLPGGEIIRRCGRVPSTRANSSAHGSTWRLGLHKVAKYYYYPGFHEPGSALSLVVNKKLVGLPRTHRAQRHRYRRGGREQSFAGGIDRQECRLRSRLLANDPAIKIRKFDDSILQSLGKISGEVLADTSRKDELTRRVYDSFMKFRTAAVRWSEISDRAYLNARALKFPIGG